MSVLSPSRLKHPADTEACQMGVMDYGQPVMGCQTVQWKWEWLKPVKTVTKTEK